MTCSLEECHFTLSAPRLSLILGADMPIELLPLTLVMGDCVLLAVLRAAPSPAVLRNRARHVRERAPCIH